MTHSIQRNTSVLTLIQRNTSGLTPIQRNTSGLTPYSATRQDSLHTAQHIRTRSILGGTILVHIGTNNADKEGTTAIVDKYRKLLKKTKEARVEQIILSGILPVFGNRLDGYRNAKRMAINGMVKRLCKEEDVGYVDLWDSLVGKEEMYARDGLHLSGKGAAVFAEGLSGAVASGLGKVRYLN